MPRICNVFANNRTRSTVAIVVLNDRCVEVQTQQLALFSVHNSMILSVSLIPVLYLSAHILSRASHRPYICPFITLTVH